jgi:hypothetical protein
MGLIIKTFLVTYFLFYFWGNEYDCYDIKQVEFDLIDICISFLPAYINYSEYKWISL